MNAQQRKALEQCMSELSKSINYENVKCYFLARNIVDSGEFQIIEAKNVMDTGRTISFLQLIQGKDNAWQHLLNYCNEKNQRFLTNMLLSAEKAPREDPAVATSTASPARIAAATSGSRDEAYKWLRQNANSPAFYPEGVDGTASLLEAFDILKAGQVAQIRAKITGQDKVWQLCVFMLAHEDSEQADKQLIDALGKSGLGSASKEFRIRLTGA